MNTFQISNMFRLLLLLLVLMSSTAFAQAPNEIPQAVKFDDFGNVNNGDVKARLDAYFAELLNNPSTQGLITNYGSERQISRRERLIKFQIGVRKFDASRITFANGRFSNEQKTEFWLVPAGAENPKFDATAEKFDEIGKAYNGEIKARMAAFFAELDAKKDSQGYIYNYGTPTQIAAREKIIKNTIPFRRIDAVRITIVNGGKGIGLKTILWIVPVGAEVPTP